jgi:short-subunit dehydrogenase
MIEKRRGSIVTTVSSGISHHSHGGGYVALRPGSREMPYQSAKAALATLSFYLADEVRTDNVAVNIVVPGHTRTTGFDEQNRARLERGAKPGPIPMVAAHMVPLVMHLAMQDASGGVTGKMFDVMTWNIEHGLGGSNARPTIPSPTNRSLQSERSRAPSCACRELQFCGVRSGSAERGFLRNGAVG